MGEKRLFYKHLVLESAINIFPSWYYSFYSVPGFIIESSTTLKTSVIHFQ